MGSTASRRQQPHSHPPSQFQPLSSDEASVRASLLGGYQRIGDGPVEHLAQEAANARRRIHYRAKLAACCYNTRTVLGQICTCQTILALVMLMIVATVMWFHWDQLGPASKAVHRIARTTTTTTISPAVVFE